jgi:phage shock protein C
MIAGVAGGLAELWDVDPSLVRVAWVILVPLTGGIALLVYAVMALIVPDEDGSLAWDTYVGWPTPSSGRTQNRAPFGPTAASGPVAAPAPGAPSGPSSPPAGAAAAAASEPPSTTWPSSRHEAREIRRAAKRDARAARHADHDHDGRSAAMIVGVLFVLAGLWFLVREYLPSIDWGWFWPLVLVGIGLVVLFLAVRPRPDDASPGPDDREGPPS